MRRILIPIVLTTSSCLLACNQAHADLIDFETGFVDRQQILELTTPTNKIMISLNAGGPAEIAEVGGPITAFEPRDDPLGGFPGRYFMHDGSTAFSRNFIFIFDNPVSSLSFDLYDFEASGRTATLSTFTNQNQTGFVGEDTSGGSPEDGGIVKMSFTSIDTPFKSAIFELDRIDRGYGIDNIQFTTVPEPAFLSVLTLGLPILLRRKRRY